MLGVVAVVAGLAAPHASAKKRPEPLTRPKVTMGGVLSRTSSGATVETGTLRGVRYEAWGDYGAHFAAPLDEATGAQWDIYCEDDEMNDTRACVARLVDLSVLVNNAGIEDVWVGGKHVPGSVAAIRVDDGAPIRWEGAKGPASNQVPIILGQLRAGSVALTRYRKWPRDYDIDHRVNVSGIAAVLDYLRWAAKREPQPIDAPARD